MEETEDHQQPTELEKEIFGDSDSSISYSGEAMEDVEQEQLKGSEESEEEDADEVESEDSDDDDLGKKKPSSKVDGTSEKILEARREFDEALEKIKTGGSRRGQKLFETGAPVDLDDIAEKFVKRMAKAADSDCDAVEAGQPALEKQKMLHEVIDMLTKRHFHEVLLDNEVLISVRRWLEPLPNRTLPSPNIRKALLEILKTLPIETVHLRESGLGKIVNFFGQRSGELDDIRRLSNDLVGAWSRPIIQRTSMANDDSEQQSSGSGMRGSGHILRSESLRSGPGSRRYSGGTLETRKQKKIVQSLAKKRAKPAKF